jgi:hypothetical protein
VLVVVLVHDELVLVDEFVEVVELPVMVTEVLDVVLLVLEVEEVLLKELLVEV